MVLSAPRRAILELKTTGVRPYYFGISPCTKSRATCQLFACGRVGSATHLYPTYTCIKPHTLNCSRIVLSVLGVPSFLEGVTGATSDVEPPLRYDLLGLEDYVLSVQVDKFRSLTAKGSGLGLAEQLQR